ncbi:hypothetical protein ACFZBU_06365 [Embleya sp. NPDC008237]|uniref:hypothetical protein n=1 Tax=Embleya sp. NPDC008237 TaxID=3363978 RepID=UPI0036E17D61
MPGWGALLLLPFALRGAGLRGLGPYKWPLAVFAVTEFVGPWWMLSEAERRLSSSTTGLLIASVPIFGAVLVYLTGGGERMGAVRCGAVRWAGPAIGFGGVAVLAGLTLAIGASCVLILGGAVLATRRNKGIPTRVRESRAAFPVRPASSRAPSVSSLRRRRTTSGG